VAGFLAFFFLLVIVELGLTEDRLVAGHCRDAGMLKTWNLTAIGSLALMDEIGLWNTQQGSKRNRPFRLSATRTSWDVSSTFAK